MKKVFAVTTLFCLMVISLGVSVANAELVGTNYFAMANDGTPPKVQINNVGSVSDGNAFASVSANSMSAGYNGAIVIPGTGAGAGMSWTALANTTIRVIFDYAITNPYSTSPKSQYTSFQVAAIDQNWDILPFNYITYAGSGRFDQVLNLATLDTFWINVNAVGPDEIGGMTVNLSNMNVAPVPIPAAVWLLGTGLVGLFGVRRRFTKS